MKRKQFTFYRSFRDSIEQLPTNKEKLQAYQMLCNYALDREEPPTDGKKPSAVMLFAIMRPILDKAHERAEKCSTVAQLSKVL